MKIPKVFLKVLGVKEGYIGVEVKSEDLPKDFQEEQPQRDFRIFLVLDTSGSMSSRLEMIKKSIKTYISPFILGRRGTLSIVTYSSQSKKICLDQNDEIVINKIVEGIRASGGTNLEVGLKDVKDEISTKIKEKDTRLTRLWLFSDGMINEGLIDHEKLIQKLKEFECPVYTFGVCDQYDEKLLKSIATETGGAYYYLENEEDAKNSINAGFSSILEIGIQNVKLVYTSSKGKTVTLPLGDLFYGDLRKTKILGNKDEDFTLKIVDKDGNEVATLSETYKENETEELKIMLAIEESASLQKNLINNRDEKEFEKLKKVNNFLKEKKVGFENAEIANVNTEKFIESYSKRDTNKMSKFQSLNDNINESNNSYSQQTCSKKAIQRNQERFVSNQNFQMKQKKETGGILGFFGIGKKDNNTNNNVQHVQFVQQQNNINLSQFQNNNTN